MIKLQLPKIMEIFNVFVTNRRPWFVRIMGVPTRPDGERSRTTLFFLLLSFNLNLVPLVVSWPLL